MWYNWIVQNNYTATWFVTCQVYHRQQRMETVFLSLLTVNTRFSLFPVKKKYAIFSVSNDNPYTFVYDHLNQSMDEMVFMEKTTDSSLIGYMWEVPYPRAPYNQKHKFLDIVIITVTAVLSGMDTWNEIEDWASARREWIGQSFRTAKWDPFTRHYKPCLPDDWPREVPWCLLTVNRCCGWYGQRRCCHWWEDPALQLRGGRWPAADPCSECMGLWEYPCPWVAACGWKDKWDKGDTRACWISYA